MGWRFISATVKLEIQRWGDTVGSSVGGGWGPDAGGWDDCWELLVSRWAEPLDNRV